jgi:hypothetical protein
MAISEEQLSNWTKPASDSEETRIENAISMVRDAINSDGKLSKMNLEIFCQGSYANNTNVRLNSDVDINVRHNGIYLYNIPQGMQKEQFPDLVRDPDGQYSFSSFKNDVENALKAKFGHIIRKNKCLHISENSYHTEVDVVPTFKHRWYKKDGSYDLGVALFADQDGSKIVNYPLQHIENGIAYNERTSRRFKRLVRIFKNIQYDMQEKNIPLNKNISSFLLECLVWNCPLETFNPETWNARLRKAMVHIYEKTKSRELCDQWVEVSNLLLLFYGHKWNYEDVNQCMIQMYNYVFEG